MNRRSNQRTAVVISIFLLVLAFGSLPAQAAQTGSIVAWGYNGSGQCNVPAPNSGFVAIAAGHYHSLGLKDDGPAGRRIAAWGHNYQDQCNVPVPNSSFIAIAGGYLHSLGLKTYLYELIGDINNDCRVDLLDFALMAANWPIDCFAEPSNPACVPLQ